MMTAFVTVGIVDEIQPGAEPLVVEVNRRWIAVYNIDGEFYAIEDRCTHDDGPLAEGKLCGSIVECPRHGATFDVKTGKVLSPPALVDVPAYEVQVQGDNIQVGPRKN